MAEFSSRLWSRRNDDWKQGNASAFLILNPQRFRQFYHSLDVDLTKITTKSHFLKIVFSVLIAIKIPAPTIESIHFNDIKHHFIYF